MKKKKKEKNKNANKKITRLILEFGFWKIDSKNQNKYKSFDNFDRKLFYYRSNYKQFKFACIWNEIKIE